MNSTNKDQNGEVTSCDGIGLFTLLFRVTRSFNESFADFLTANYKKCLEIAKSAVHSQHGKRVSSK